MSSPASDAIVLSGCGWVTPAAAGGIQAVMSAVRSNPARPSGDGCYWAIDDDVIKGHAGLAKELKGDRGAGITGIALDHARQTAQLEPGSVPPERAGLVLGCALAGQLGMISFANEVRSQTARFVSPIHFPQTVGNYISGALARGFDIKGPNMTLASGSASGLDAIVEGVSLIAANAADVVYAGGTDTLTPELAGELAQKGPTLSEGACLFVIERADAALRRGAPILATIVGTSRSGGSKDVEPPADAIISVCDSDRAGAVFIEHWVGRCPGAAGPAAAAAAIAAGRGIDVPLLTANGVTTGLPAAPKRDSAGGVPAMVLAMTDDHAPTIVELSIPTVD